MEGPKKGGSGGKGAADAVRKLLQFLAAIPMAWERVRDGVLERAEGFLRRFQYLFMVYLWISVGLVFLVLGIFDLLIDQMGIPRGVVYSLGGALLSLVSVIFLQAAKMKKHR